MLRSSTVYVLIFCFFVLYCCQFYPLTKQCIFCSSGVLYNKASESLLRILENLFKSGILPSSEDRRKMSPSYQLKLRPLNVDGEDLLSKG